MDFEDRLKKLREKDNKTESSYTERLNAIKEKYNVTPNMADLLPEPEQTGSHATYVSHVDREPDYRDPLTEIAREEAARASRVPLTDHVTETAQVEPTYGVQSVAPGRGGERGTTPQKQSFFGALGSFFKELPSLVGQGIQTTAQNKANMATDDVVDPLEAASLGFAQGTGVFSAAKALGTLGGNAYIPDAGMYLTPGNAAIADEMRKQSEAMYADNNKLAQDLNSMLAEAKTAQPIAYGAGEMGGNLALMGAVGGAVGAVPGMDALRPVVRGAISGGATLGGSAAIKGAGEVATGGMTPEEYLRSVASKTIGGAAGGAAAGNVSEIGNRLLDGLHGYGFGADPMLTGNTNGIISTLAKFGLEHNNLARTIVAGLAGANFVGSNINASYAAEKLLGGDPKKLTVGEYAREVLLGAAFGAIRQYASTVGNETAAKAASNGEQAALMVQQAAESGNTEAYSTALTVLHDSVTEINNIIAGGGVPTAEAAQATEIINRVVSGIEPQVPTASTEAVTPKNNLPQYQQIPQAPVDAQRAQVGSELAQRVTAQQNAPAAQSARNAPAEGKIIAPDESTAVNDKVAGHTPEEQRIIEEYKNAVDENLVTYYQEHKNNQTGRPYYLKNVGDRAAADIQAITGKPVTADFKTAFDARQAWHVNNDHGAQGKSDQTMKDDQDVGRIQYILDNYDRVEAGGTTDAYWEPKENGGNRQAQTVVFSKKVNGTYYAVEAVPITKAKTVNIVSAYMLGEGKTPPGRLGQNKTGTVSQLPDANAPWFTAKTDSANVVPVDQTIAQPEQNVNGVAQPGSVVYNAGNEPKEGIINGGEETAGSVRPDNSGLRAGRGERKDVEGRVPGETERSSGTDGSGQTLSRGTGKETIQVKDRGAAKDPEVGNLTFGDEVDASYFGIKDANPNTKFRIVTSGETQHTKNARNIASGSELIAYYGEEFSAGGKDYIEAGWVSRANKIFAPVNSKHFTIDHYVGHEVCHREIDRGNISLKSILDQAKADLPAGSLEEALGIYDVLYPENDDVENLTELICDAAGYMNRIRAYKWQDVDRFIDILDEVLSAIHNMVDDATGGVFSTVPGLKDDAIPSNNSVAQADNPQALRNFNAETGKPDGLGKQIETPTDELKFSRTFDSQYMEAAFKANDKLKNVKPAVMKKAQEDREVVKKQLDKVSDMLPPDITGNTWYQDSSYGGSEENSTVCVRSLAYEEFMDSVAEQLGRPLTVSDTVFISQEAMAMTDKPECLYCYVAMDRKSYRQFLGEYIDQRNAFLADVKAGKEVGLVEPVKKGPGVSRTVPNGTAYGDFLNGRANTPATYRRAKLWLDSDNLITKKDLASASAMNKVAQGNLKAQIADAQAYAQSASWAKKKNGYAAYNNHILKWSAAKVKKLNQMYGMRMYSFSDYSPAFILENMQMVTDAAVKGLKVLAYSKELDFVRIFAPTGMNINISVFGYNDGKGGVAMDAMQGADWEQAKLLRDQYPNVGCTFVATNDAQVDWALAQDWIDVVIPFHLVRTGAKVADMFGWTNYTQMSADKKNGDLGKDANAHIYPYEHQNDKDAFLELCDEKGLTPRFEKWVGNPNYMKLVNETRRSEANTPTVQPIFNTQYAEGSIDEMVKRGGYMQHIGGTTENMNLLAKETAEKILAKENDVKFSTAPDAGAEERLQELDKKYLAAVDSDDMETAQKMVDEAAKAAGYTVRAWHQTARDFTVFNTNNPVAALNDSETPNGIFFKTNDHDIGLEGKKQMPMFLNLGRTLNFKNREEANAWYRKNVDGYDALAKKMESVIKPIDDQMQEIENQMFAAGTTDEEYERLDKEWNALLEKMHVEEDKYRGQLRALLDEYFLGKNKPYDSIHLGYDGHRYVDGKRENVETYIVFSNTQAKSADPVTYDDNGNVIPISERFNTKNEDIRFSSASEIDRLEAENERLRKRLEEARAETKLTRGWKADPRDVERAAKTIADSASSKISQTVLQNRLTKLVEDASNGKISDDEIMATAGSIARDVVEKSSILASKDLDSYNAAKGYLKKVYISVPQELRDRFDDFKFFADTHKMLQMKHDGVPIKDVYEELQRDLGTEYFPDLPGDKQMLEQIGNVMESLTPVYGNQYSFAMQTVIEEMSNEVLDAALDIGQKVTVADKADAKLRESKAETKAATAKLKTAESYIRSLQRIATRRAEQNEALKQHYAETRKRQTEARNLRQSQDKLMRVLKRLNNRKLPMATKNEILDAQNAVAGVIDTIGKSFSGEIKAKRYTDMGITDVGQLQDWVYRKTTEGVDPAVYDPNFIVDAETKRILDRLKMVSVKDLTANQIKELTQALLNIEARIAAEKKFVNSQLAMEFYQAGTQVMHDIDQAKPGHLQRKLRPLSAFLRMADYNDDSPLVIAYKEMLRGEEEADLYRREAIKPFSTLLSDHKWLKDMYGKDAKTIMLTGTDIDGHNVTVEITPMMRIALYLHSLNDDNFRHLYEGGIVVPDMKWYRKGDLTKAYNEGTTVRLSRPVLQRLAEEMTPKERQFAKILQDYYNNFAPKRMNPVSLALDGWEKFTTPDYYPLNTDRNFLNADYEAKLFAADASLARPGWGEERVHSKKPVVLYDANTTFLKMLAQNSMYAHQAIPLHNMNRLLNVQLVDNRDSVKAAMNRQFPDSSADKYVSKFMSDYAGHRRNDSTDVGKILEKLRSNYAGAVLTLAVSTAGVQFASYPVAMAVVSPTALIKALNPSKINLDFIDKRTAIFTKRTEGLSMMEMAELREQGKHIPKVLNWIQAVDVGTTSLLKRAAWYDVREKQPNLRPGTEEFEKAVTDTYIRIIEETQPNYSASLRPDLLRTDDAFERQLILFATQPLQQYGILYDAIGRYESASRHYKTNKTEETKEAKKKAAKGVGRAAGVIVAASVLYATLKVFSDFLMGNFEKKYLPKEGSDESWVLTFLRQYGLNMLGGITGMWPIGKTAVDVGMTIADTATSNLGGKPLFGGKKFYGVEVASIAAISDTLNDLVSAVNYLTRAIAGKSEAKTAAKKVIALAEDVCTLLGVPAERAHAIIKAVVHHLGIDEDALYDLVFD